MKTKEEILDTKFKMESPEHDTKIFLYDALDAMDEYNGQLIIKIQKLKKVLESNKETMTWMWENLHKEHTSDHFNIPANAINEVENQIKELEKWLK